MTRQHPHSSHGQVEAVDLEALDAQFAAEDRTDLHDEAQRRRLGLPHPSRNLRVFHGFANFSAVGRTGA